MGYINKHIYYLMYIRFYHQPIQSTVLQARRS